jgi:hypothetical protein
MSLESLRVSVGGNAFSLPDWARTAVELGAYARYAAASRKTRLIICCVVPCRNVFTGLVGLGSIIAGGRLFRKGFSWEDLMSLEPGTEIYWKINGESHNYTGVLEPHEEIHGQTLVPVTISKPSKKKGRWYFSESKFRECVFSEESLPSVYASERFSIAESFYDALGVSATSKWLMTAGAEVRFVTRGAQFKRTLEGWAMTSNLESVASSLDQLLILREEADSSLAKARITHHMGTFVSDCPVSIIDGPLAFQRIPDIESGSLVVVLEREELADEHVDLLLQASNEHSLECEQELSEFAFSDIPATVEVTGYCFKLA